MRSKHSPEQKQHAALLWPAQAYDPTTIQCPIVSYDMESPNTKSATPSEHASNVHGTDGCEQQWFNKCQDDCNCQYSSDAGCTSENSASGIKYNFKLSSNSEGIPCERFISINKSLWFDNNSEGYTASSCST